MKSQWMVLASAFLMILGVEKSLSCKSKNKIVYESNEVWGWKCVSGNCENFILTEETKESALSLSVCKLQCNEFGSIWPRPSTNFVLGSALTHLNSNDVFVIIPENNPATNLLTAAAHRFHRHIRTILPDDGKINEGDKSVLVKFNIQNLNAIDLNLDTDEAYTLQLFALSNGSINALINSQTFFGARHALETLDQLLVFDNIKLQLLIPSELTINNDKPVYPYRGISLDTARNYFSVESIKRTIDAMGTCKLNRFHWHITDSHSFPFVSKSQPDLTKLGAPAPNKVYTESVIQGIVQYGLERGVKVIPEFDAPAHVGEGWQGTDMTVCFKAEPWTDYCVEPPCGQLDPTKANLYDVLEGIYTDLIESFKPDIFHMGGDEVSNSCWNSSPDIRTWMIEQGWEVNDVGFLKLWDHFQKNAIERVYKANGGKKLPIILWMSTLTEYQHIEQYLNKDDYIIQLWSTGTDPEIAGLLSKGYRVIFTNHDALYLDCGFGAWVGEGNNWCSPYIGWQKVYDNSPAQMAGGYNDLILGGEAALWTEQVDTSCLDSRLWPRAGALAERLWAEPSANWRSAEKRMLQYRERLVRLGISADALQPEWCNKNEGHCYL